MKLCGVFAVAAVMCCRALTVNDNTFTLPERKAIKLKHVVRASDAQQKW